MKKDVLSRINKLKEDLVAVSASNPQKTEDLEAYLSQSYRKSQSPEPFGVPNQVHYRLILDEKIARITELEEEVAFLRESSKSREQDLISKYEKAIDSIKSNCDGLVNYYESQLLQSNPSSEVNENEKLQKKIQLLELENLKLKNELKNQNESTYKEKNNLIQEISLLKDKFNESEFIKNKDEEESVEIEELREVKEKLEKEICNLQRSKNDFFNDDRDYFEEKYIKAVEIAENWKTRADQLALKFFTFLRMVKIDLYEIKNYIYTNFEEATTSASLVIMKVFKKYKIVTSQ